MAQHDENIETTTLLEREIESCGDLWDALDEIKQSGVRLGEIIPHMNANKPGSSAILNLRIVENLDVRDDRKTWAMLLDAKE